MAAPKGRILCTEDDEDTRELIVLTLDHAGYEMTCTDNAEDAVEILRKDRFDLCLIDNWMPGVSGEELCRKIREFDTKTPILFYSGAGFPQDKERARIAGAQGYLVKPVLDDELVAEVARLIAASKAGFPVAVVPPGHSEPIKTVD